MMPYANKKAGVVAPAFADSPLEPSDTINSSHAHALQFAAWRLAARFSFHPETAAAVALLAGLGGNA